jgi:hypothetical protein
LIKVLTLSCGMMVELSPVFIRYVQKFSPCVDI